MPWLEWCPDPQQPDAQRVKIFHPGSWTRQEEHDAPPPPHTYREWKEFYVPNPDQEGAQPNVSIWYKRDWATEGYRRVAAPQAGHGVGAAVLAEASVSAREDDVVLASPSPDQAARAGDDAPALKAAAGADVHAGCVAPAVAPPLRRQRSQIRPAPSALQSAA